MREPMRKTTAAVLAGLALSATANAEEFGGFAPVVTLPAGGDPVSVTLEDLDRDGAIDIAIANKAGDSLTLYYGYGDGTFEDGVAIDAGYRPLQVRTGDMNNDGAPDLIVLNEQVAQGVFRSSINVILADGDGYAPGVQYLQSDRSVAFDIGDLNGDGILDFVTCEPSDSTLSVRLGNGDGTFGLQQTYPNGILPSFLMLADHTGDGVLDALSGSNRSNEPIFVLPGDGQGGFGAVMTHPIPEHFIDTLTQGDVNGDGWLDVLATNENDFVFLCLGIGGGSFAPVTTLDFVDARDVSGAILSDLNGDGDVDLILTTLGVDRVLVYLGNGDGTFQESVSFPTGFNDFGGAVGDLDNDRSPDLVIPSPARNVVRVLINKTFLLPKPFALLAPADGTVGLALPEIVAGWFTPALRWQSAVAGATYRVEVATDEAFEDIVLEFFDVDATNVEVPAGALLPDTRYYWRVTASTPPGETQSDPFPATFTTAKLADLNGDGVVDSFDLAALLAGWGD